MHMKTCSTIYKLTQSRYLWIAVLERTRATRCLPCPTGEDLSQRNLQDLQCIARHAHRLERNWDRGSPRIIGAVRAIQHGNDISIAAVIPGTDLVILYSNPENELYCFDMQTITSSPGLCFAELNLNFSAHYDEYGQHLMGFVSMGPGQPR
jgi:hypothetical protein